MKEYSYPKTLHLWELACKAGRILYLISQSNEMRNDVASQRYMRSAAKLFPAVVQKSNEQGKKQWSDSLMMQTAEVISEIIAYYNHLKYEHITPSDNFDAAEALITEIEEIIGEDDSDDKGQKAS